MRDDTRVREVHRLADCAEPLSRAYDLAMLDLDGVVYRGERAVPRAVAALGQAHDGGMRLAYVTNNASRTPEAVVERLRALDVPVRDGEVVTSAQAAARVLSTMLPAGARVLLVGGDGLVAALAERGLEVVRSMDDAPEAVVQGFDPAVAWADLAEGAYAVATGMPWVASNPDLTIPTARGVAPGNGALVEVIARVTGRAPIVVGKPEPPLFDETVLRVGGSRPLVVGDRLDTDIEGANAVGVDSLLVLTGVSGLRDVVHAPPRLRPTYVGRDLDALHEPQPPVETVPGACTCEGITIRDVGGRYVPEATGTSPAGDAVALLRATVALAWNEELSVDRPADLGDVQHFLEQVVR